MRLSHLARIRLMLSRQPWLGVCVFLATTRVLLNIPALAGANLWPLRDDGAQKTTCAAATTLPGVWGRWDSGFYLQIAAKGYPLQGAEINFFPAYPVAIRLFSLGDESAMCGTGYLISNLAFILAALLLWQQVKLDYGQSIAWGTILTLSLFPTALFFSAIYTESLFLLFSVLVYWCTARQKYGWAGLFVSLASLTRIYGLLLILLPLIELLRGPLTRRWLKAGATVCLSGAGLSAYSLYLGLVRGSPLAFVLSQESIMKRTITLPGYSLLNSLGVILWGNGGFATNWFMREVSVMDLLAISLFIGCAIAAYFVLKQKGLVVYLGAAVLALSASHGPYTLGVYAMSRYVLVLFPGFIVLSCWLERRPRLKWVVWATSALALCALTVWFGHGGWIA